MVLISVLCPCCQSDQAIKGGKTQASIQLPKLGRSMPFSSISYQVAIQKLSPAPITAENCGCYIPQSAVRNPQFGIMYAGRLAEIKKRIVDMSLNSSGI